MLRVVFMGTPGFAVPPLERLVLDGHDVVAVYTQPDREAGRGRVMTASPVKQAADAMGLRVVQPTGFKGARVMDELAGFRPDVIVVAAFGDILPQAVLDLPRHRCLNIHPSLLPRYRGASPVAGAIMAGDDFAGITIMLMDAGMDTGPLLQQAQVSISPDDTTDSLTDKLSLVSAHLLLDVLPRWVEGDLAPSPQDEAGATYTSLLTKAEGEIDWNLSALEVWRRVRAFQPWPGCYTMWSGKQLKIIGAEPLPEERPLAAGQVTALPQGFGVGTGRGVLGVRQVQLEGKRVMSAAEFVRGQPGILGALLPD